DVRHMDYAGHNADSPTPGAWHGSVRRVVPGQPQNRRRAAAGLVHGLSSQTGSASRTCRRRSPGNGDGQRPNTGIVGRFGLTLSGRLPSPQARGPLVSGYVALHLPSARTASLGQSLDLETRGRKASLTWSPVTESNRRPSPYHGTQLPVRDLARRRAAS